MKNATKTNKTKEFDLRQVNSVLYQLSRKRRALPWRERGNTLRYLTLLLLLSCTLLAQDRKVDPTWLHRYVPRVSETTNNFTSATCHYKPMFGAGDADSKILRSVARFGEVSIDARGVCQSQLYDREEQIFFVLEGKPVLQYGDQKFPMRANDFTYIAPGASHAIANASDQTSRILVMSFRVPQKISISPPSATPKIVNLDDLKEETVDGHPNSVLYKLLVGPRTAKRDAIDDGYVVTSFFWMDFAPGGTNFPHHHETAEEIYLLLDGQGNMVAGSGTDGIEGRYPANAGDAYYFRPNCTVGFYNADTPGAKAHILAVRSRIPLPEDDD